jgi:CIC family chloride channel protein
VKDLMTMPDIFVKRGEAMESVVAKFNDTTNYNLPVLENNKYIGFVSRANVFSAYRKLIKEYSDE